MTSTVLFLCSIVFAVQVTTSDATVKCDGQHAIGAGQKFSVTSAKIRCPRGTKAEKVMLDIWDSDGVLDWADRCTKASIPLQKKSETEWVYARGRVPDGFTVQCDDGPIDSKIEAYAMVEAHCKKDNSDDVCIYFGHHCLPSGVYSVNADFDFTRNPLC